MPQVPFLPQQTIDKEKFVPSPTEIPAVSADKEIRKQFEQSVKHEIAATGGVTVSFLDQFAASHFDKTMADAPVVADYAALRQAARQEENQRTRQQAQQQALHEGEWMVKIGALLPDNASLHAYLETQLPMQQMRLEQSGLSAQDAAGQTNRFRAQTVEKHILRSLSDDDWQTAQQVLTVQGACLDDSVQARCAQQIRHTFAKQQAKQLFQAALSQHDHQPQLAQTLACEQLQEPDKELKKDIQREIVDLAHQTRRQQALAQADLFGQLSQVDNEQKTQLLARQTLLRGDDFAIACEAAQQPEQPASPAQQAWFVKNYFNSTTDMEQAYAKGLCSPQDYFHLKSVQQKLRGGKEARAQHWLCRAIETWMNKQGFSSQDITQASYQVLGGSSEEEQLQIWKQLKTLLTY